MRIGDAPALERTWASIRLRSSCWLRMQLQIAKVGFGRKLAIKPRTRKNPTTELMAVFAVDARIVGLLGPRSQLNGEHVEVLGFIAEPVARWRVRRRANGELLLLRSANLLNVVAQPALVQPCSTMEASSDIWAAGGALPKAERYSEEKLPPSAAERLVAEVETDQAEEAAGAEAAAAEAERLSTKVIETDETDETVYAQAQRPDSALPQLAVDGRMGGAKAITVMTEDIVVPAPARSPNKVDTEAVGRAALRTPSSPPATCMQPDHLATIPGHTISPDRPSSTLKFPLPPQAYSMERATAQASGAHRASRSFQRISRERGRVSERVGAERSAAQSMVYEAMERAAKSVAASLASRPTSQSRDLAASTSQSRDLAACTSQSRDLTGAEASSSSSTSVVTGVASALIDAHDRAHDSRAAPVNAARAVDMLDLTPSPKAVDKAVSPPSPSSQLHTQDEEERSSGVRSPAIHLDASRCCRSCGPCLCAGSDASRCISMHLARSCGPCVFAGGTRARAPFERTRCPLRPSSHTH